ncbi:MAG: Ig-like domain-containing protein [Tannerellaceae bacterium]|nr:Ig-like domain-containing protein [Tannerellaceae bacterium]
MRSRYVKNSLLAIYGMFLLVVVHSCANMGTPNGGPYDDDPPRFISSTPFPNQTNYSGKKIEILFDELIQVEKPSENVIITPPQKDLPIIRTAGRRVVIELKDTLLENTTYTIDFTNSIADNNEKNVLENFSFAFSTGDVIDSLEVSGILLNAENLEPMSGITIGLHSNLEDSAFVTLPFIRTSRTNDRGQFTIRNIAPGTYRIYALNDVNRDYMFDQPGEDIAFLDSLIVPYLEQASRQDTIWADSLTIDTIYTVGFNRYLPDNIQLRLFKEEFERQYILRPERPEEKRFTLRFNAPLDTIPTPVPVNFYPADSIWYFSQEIEGGRAVNYWIMDSTVWKQDTLMLGVSYLKSDSLNILRPQTDTVRAAIRRMPTERRKKKNNDEPEPVDFLEMQINASGTRDIFDTITIAFSEPVIHIEKELFFLNQKQDTLWVPVDFDFIPDSVNSLNFFIQRPWRYGKEYLLEVDSATIFSIYDKWNDTYSSQFKIRLRDEYGHLYINIQGIDEPAFVELLTSGDKPVRQAPVKDGGVLFMDLKPDKYYARLIVDRNQNGKWDTGNYAEKLQPEEVFYSPKMYDVKQNWEVEETWDVRALPLPEQKSLEITKNKPKEDVKRNRDYRDEGKKRR